MENGECDCCGLGVERAVRNPIAATICRTFLSRQAVLQETSKVLEQYDSLNTLVASAEGSLFKDEGGGSGFSALVDIVN